MNDADRRRCSVMLRRSTLHHIIKTLQTNPKPVTALTERHPSPGGTRTKSRTFQVQLRLPCSAAGSEQTDRMSHRKQTGLLCEAPFHVLKRSWFTLNY